MTSSAWFSMDDSTWSCKGYDPIIGELHHDTVGSYSHLWIIWISPYWSHQYHFVRLMDMHTYWSILPKVKFFEVVFPNFCWFNLHVIPHPKGNLNTKGYWKRWGTPVSHIYLGLTIILEDGYFQEVLLAFQCEKIPLTPYLGVILR